MPSQLALPELRELEAHRRSNGKRIGGLPVSGWCSVAVDDEFAMMEIT